MNKKIIGITLAIICLNLVNTTIIPHLPPIHSHIPRTYRMNLEDSPEKRWAPLINDYK
jgi:hypothetical protein